MKIVLAISGGVDSIVMLDFCCKFYDPKDLIVAHFDHNMRKNSAEDLEFVRRIAEERGLEFISEKAEIGACTSEESARELRYDFLRRVAAEKQAEIFTAHHLDDLVETVAINFIRGTGWRGLAVLDTPNIRRPFLETEYFFEPMDKAAIFEYAAKRGLRFREDPTNSSDEYLRNRLRHGMNNFSEDLEDTSGKNLYHGTNNFSYEEKLGFYNLWQKQKELKREIDGAVRGILPRRGEKWQRGWFRELERGATKEDRGSGADSGESLRRVALEILRAGTLRAGVQATRPQLEDFRKAILEYMPGKKFNLPGDRLVKFTKETFEL